jgi:sterol desaturase/sphingolipid hydroxylase (fatty acid hydroxylase superfamily)
MNVKLPILIAALVALFALEGLFPYYRDRRNRVVHAVPHVITALVNGVLTRFFLALITLQTVGWAQAHTLGIVRMIELPAAIRTVTVFLLFDIWMYYWHLLNHRVGFLWRFHRAHHADIAMDTTTALRFHPGELVLSSFIRLPVLTLIGMRFDDLVIFETVLNVSTLFHHSNLNVPEKWDRVLRVLVVTPNMHRVHHSVVREETNSNYTSILSVWDRLARTFSMRKDPRAIVLGLPNFREERYQRLRGFMVTPFL